MNRIRICYLVLIAALGSQTASATLFGGSATLSVTAGAETDMDDHEEKFVAPTDGSDATIDFIASRSQQLTSALIAGTIRAGTNRAGINISGQTVGAPSGGAFAQLRSGAQFDDEIRVHSKTMGAGEKVAVHAHMRLKGSLSALASVTVDDPISPPEANVGIGVAVHGTGLAIAPLQHPPFVPLPADNYVGLLVQTTLDGVSPIEQDPPPTIPILLSAVVGDVLDLSYDMEVNAWGNGGAFSGSATTSFSANIGHTFAWDGIDSVVDANTGMPLPRDDWSVTSASGFDYSQPAPEVPEPSSIVLLSAGIIVLLCVVAEQRGARRRTGFACSG
jgi:hypothetical protein